MSVAAVILAAGQSTRFRSARSKVLHPLCGRPMILWSVESARAAGAAPIVLVVAPAADDIRATVGDGVTYATQDERLGTAHAALQAREALLGRAEIVLLTYADMPAVKVETLQRLIARHRERRPAVTLLTARSCDAMGFGRVVRDDSGNVRAVVEEAVADADVLALDELNCGVYCFDAPWLWERLPQVPRTPPKNEYYLPDMVAMAVADGRSVEAMTTADVPEVQGINTRVHLARCEGMLRRRITEEHMVAGVTIVDPATTYIDPDVRIGQDTVVQPNTHVQGRTVIGSGCEIGPNSMLRDAHIGDACRVWASVVEEARMDDGAEIGPYGHLRAGAHLGRGVHMGNYGEVKNAYLAPGVKMGHFSYVGDAEIGEETNIGAGTITCNYDGRRKHRTTIERGAFIGSGTLLVAPVKVGPGAVIGAGSVVTRDIPADTLAYGVPARPQRPVTTDEDADGAP